jgi:SAM-dependent methyltransferase
LTEYEHLADLYDIEYDHDYDLPFWLELAEHEAGPIVEWGAGTGRIATPLARSGHDVTAVEISGEMVSRGREKGGESGSAEWITGDMRHADPSREFRLAVCAFNSFLCLTGPDDALTFLANAAAHLKPGGMLGIEVSAFRPEELATPHGGPALQHDLTRDLPDGGMLERFSLSTYDAAEQLLSMRLFYELYGIGGVMYERRSGTLEIRTTTRDELTLMLRLSGFTVEEVYGGFDGEPFTAESDHLIVLARLTSSSAPGRDPAS